MHLHLRRWLIFGLVLAAPPGASLSQTRTGIAEVDSAAVARGAWAKASDALRVGDLNGARVQIARAASAWPTQPAYLWAQAVLATRADDSVAALAALRRYLGLGLGRTGAESTFARYAGRPAFRNVFRRLAENAAPVGESRVLATLPDSTFWPEGVDYNPRSGTFFVASIRLRTIAEVNEQGLVRLLWAPGRRDLGAVFGVRVDPIRGILWATTSGVPQQADYVPGDSATSALLKIRIADGRIEGRWNVPVVPGGHVLGDLAVGPDGDVFMTDSYEPILYRLRPDRDTLERLTHPLFHNLQGMAPTPDGRDVFLSDYSHGLLRVSLQTGVVSRLRDAEGSTSLGCDGIVWDRGAILAVQNGVTPPRVVRFVLDAGRDAIVRVEVVDLNAALAPEPTIGTVAGRYFVYVANGQWDEHDDAGQALPGAHLTPARLVAVPLQ